MRVSKLPIPALSVVLYTTLAAAQYGGQYLESLNYNQFLKKYPAIGDKITFLTEMGPLSACQGFKNVAQCLVAAHVARNLRMNFDCLRADIVRRGARDTANCPGTRTGPRPLLYRTRLMRAIQTQRPASDWKTEVKLAKSQTERDTIGVFNPLGLGGYLYIEAQPTW